MTSPHLDQWTLSDHNYRRSEVTAFVGSGDVVWQRVAQEVLLWKIKTASGFLVDPPGPVSPGDRVVVTARVGGLTVVEPTPSMERKRFSFTVVARKCTSPFARSRERHHDSHGGDSSRSS